MWKRLFGYAALITPLLLLLGDYEFANFEWVSSVIEAYVFSILLSGIVTMILHKRREAKVDSLVQQLMVREKSMRASFDPNQDWEGGKKIPEKSNSTDYTTPFNVLNASAKGWAFDDD